MTTRSLTWAAANQYGNNTLAQGFPSFQLNAADVRRGAVKVEARSPSGRISQDLSVIETNGVYTANFTPTEVGDWNISILYEGQHIQGSPFSVRVYDAAQVKVFGLEGGSVGQTFRFSVDSAGAGEGTLTVNIMHDGHNVPAEVVPESRGMYRVTFTPGGAGIYTIKVYFAGMEVNGSPYTLEIVDSSMVTASGEGLNHIEVNRRSLFVVNTGQKGSTGDIRVTVTAPNGGQIPCDVMNNGDGTYNVEYVANDVGEYVIDVYYYGKPIQGSPFRVSAYDWNRITVKNLPNTGMVGKLCEFDIDAQNAGSGNLEIMINDGLIPCSVQNRGKRQFHATFMPKEPVPHFVQIRFNEREVNGSPWRVDVKSPALMTAAGFGLELVPVHRPAMFEVRTGLTSDYGNVHANIVSPSDRTVSTRVMNNQNGTYTIEYTPTEVGNYTISVSYDGFPLPDSPFQSKAYDSGAIVVSPIPNGIVGKPVQFTIDVTQAGEGQLEIMVNRGAVPNTVKMLRKGVFLVEFVPMDTQPHVVDIKFNGELLPRCPLNVPILDASRVTVQGDGLHQVAVNRQSQFRVTTQTNADADLRVRVTAPNGDQVPAKIVQQPDGDFKVEYSSKYTGRHTVEILYAGQAIMGSPFYVEIYDPNKIRVEGDRKGTVGQKMEFDIIRNEAGKAELGLSITGPAGRSVNYDIVPTALGDRVSYVPTEPGPHSIYITYGGLEVPGCPITQNIIDSATGIVVSGDGLYKGIQNRPSEFKVNAKGHRGDLFVNVEGPNSISRCQVEEDGGGYYTVRYTPIEVGRYTITLKWNNYALSGSPYHPEIINPSALQVIGGWSSVVDGNNKMTLQVNATKRIEFDTSMMGPGQMTCEVNGPNGRVPTYIDNQGGRTVLTFTPTVEGDHYISIFWSGLHIVNSPFHGVAQDMNRVNFEKVVLSGRGLKEAKVKEEAEFVIDGSQAGPGLPSVQLNGIKEDIDVRCVHIGDNKYRCSYVPKMAGAYLLNIMWSGRTVKGGPYKVNVIATSDASKVVAVGEGLKMGVIGRDIKATIDVRRAGPGELTAQCMGPTKTAICELFDHHDGTFTLSVKPSEPGRHMLSIMFGGEHVPGSPFELKIAGAPDASQVRVTGPGIEHGILATYISKFLCETKGAGAGQLTVRIRGPKGAFRVEMSRDSQKDRNITCRYEPREVGDYVISVKWSGEHVPGSPFRVQIYDTQAELETFLHNHPERRTNAPRLTNGWHEDI